MAGEMTPANAIAVAVVAGLLALVAISELAMRAADWIESLLTQPIVGVLSAVLMVGIAILAVVIVLSLFGLASEPQERPKSGAGGTNDNVEVRRHGH